VIDLLSDLARGWGQGSGPRVILAGLPGEQREFGILVLGLALRRRGWRVTHLGREAALEIVTSAAQRLAPQLVVVSLPQGDPLSRLLPALRTLACAFPLAVLGLGVDVGPDPGWRAERLPRDAVLEIGRISARYAARSL
jgi:hypothetical protein